MSLLNNNYLRVGLGLVIGLAAILYYKPPHTICQAQVEVYYEGMKPLSKPFVKSMAFCKEHAEPGGCAGFFDVLNKLEVKLNEVTRQCRSSLSNDVPTRNWISSSMELMARVAWGSKPPQSQSYRSGFLEVSQLSRFCHLKQNLIEIYGQESWNDFVNSLLADLPGSGELLQRAGRTEVWNRTILSDGCRYPAL